MWVRKHLSASDGFTPGTPGHWHLAVLHALPKLVYALCMPVLIGSDLMYLKYQSCSAPRVPAYKYLQIPTMLLVIRANSTLLFVELGIAC